MKFRTAPVILLVAAFACVPAAAAAQSSRTLYTRALERERILRDGREPSLQQLRNAVASYEAIARRFPSSGYTDNSLWQGANLSLLAYDRFGQAGDLQTALRLLEQLTSQYPSSSLATQARSLVRQRQPAAGDACGAAGPANSDADIAAAQGASHGDPSVARANGRDPRCEADATARRHPRQHRNGCRVDISRRAAGESAARLFRHQGSASVVSAARNAVEVHRRHRPRDSSGPASQ